MHHFLGILYICSFQLVLTAQQEKWIWEEILSDGKGLHSVAKPLIASSNPQRPKLELSDDIVNNGAIKKKHGERYEVYEENNDGRPPLEYPGHGGRPLLGRPEFAGEPPPIFGRPNFARPAIGPPPFGNNPIVLPGERPVGGQYEPPPPNRFPPPQGPNLRPLGPNPPPPLLPQDRFPLPRPPLKPDGNVPASVFPNKSPGILTGPIASWERPHHSFDPTGFNTCKCVHSFNCKSPGLQFGRCDAGKQYCCYNTPKFGLPPRPRDGFRPQLSIPGEGPPILEGPDHPEPYQPGFLRAEPRESF